MSFISLSLNMRIRSKVILSVSGSAEFLTVHSCTLL